MSHRDDHYFKYLGEANSWFFSRPFYASSKHADGGNTPFALRKNGEFTLNAYDMSIDETFNGPANFAPDGWESCFTGSYSDIGGLPSLNFAPPPAASSVLPKLLEKWRESRLDAGVSLAESHQTLDMIRSRLMPIADAAWKLKKGNLSGAAGALGVGPSRKARDSFSHGDLANTWLELRYGWLPLYYDISAAANLVSKPKTKLTRISAQVSSPGGATVNSPGTVEKLRVSTTRKLTVYLKAEPPSMPERLGLTDPFTVAWELVPFSFVIDWFLPIGDALKTIHAVRVIPAAHVVDTVIYRGEVVSSIPIGTRFNVWPYGMCNNWIESRFRISKYGGNRSASLSLDSFGVASQVPRTVNSPMDIGVKRLIDLVALTSQRLHLLS